MWLANTDCETDPNLIYGICNTLKGRCCVGSGCWPDTYQADCAAIGGDWDDSNTCDSGNSLFVECPSEYETNVCCGPINGQCSDIGWDECLINETDPIFIGVNCAACLIDPIVTCCLSPWELDTDCNDALYTWNECVAALGVPLLYASCEVAGSEYSNACVKGACCSQYGDTEHDSDCTNIILQECKDLGFPYSWYNPWSTCQEHAPLCGPGDGACCLPDGSCTEGWDDVTCSQNNGTYLSDGSICDEDNTAICLDYECLVCETTRNRNRNRNLMENYTRVEVESGECVWMMCVVPNCPYPLCRE
jgi:hypothetical protein